METLAAWSIARASSRLAAHALPQQPDPHRAHQPPGQGSLRRNSPATTNDNPLVMSNIADVNKIKENIPNINLRLDHGSPRTMGFKATARLFQS